MLPVAHAEGDSGSLYSFNLVGPNVCRATADIGENIEEGDTWRVTGSGTFNIETGAVSGDGSCTHYRDGTVYGRGTWVVTGLLSFEPYGGPNPGHQGGLLKILITLTSTHHPKGIVLWLQVCCTIGNAPEGAKEGTTLWVGPPTFPIILPLFGEVVSGRTLFHLEEEG